LGKTAAHEYCDTVPGTRDAVSDAACALDWASERYDTVDWKPVVEAAGTASHTVESIAADHHFVGQHGRVAALVAPFLAGRLSDGDR